MTPVQSWFLVLAAFAIAFVLYRFIVRRPLCIERKAHYWPPPPPCGIVETSNGRQRGYGWIPPDGVPGVLPNHFIATLAPCVGKNIARG
jgi:hypothetical protein